MNASAVFLRCYVNQRLTRCARLLLASALNLSRVRLFHLFSKYYLESICNSPSRRWAKKKEEATNEWNDITIYSSLSFFLHAFLLKAIESI